MRSKKCLNCQRELYHYPLDEPMTVSERFWYIKGFCDWVCFWRLNENDVFYHQAAMGFPHSQQAVEAKC